MPSLFNRRLVQGAVTLAGSSEKLLNIWASAVISHSIVKHRGSSVLRSWLIWCQAQCVRMCVCVCVCNRETIFGGGGVCFSMHEG